MIAVMLVLVTMNLRKAGITVDV